MVQGGIKRQKLKHLQDERGHFAKKGRSRGDFGPEQDEFCNLLNLNDFILHRILP
jgi:hypothetical protein